MAPPSGHPIRTLILLALFLVAGIGGAIYAAFVVEPVDDEAAPEHAIVVAGANGKAPAAEGAAPPVAPVVPGTDAKVRGIVVSTARRRSPPDSCSR